MGMAASKVLTLVSSRSDERNQSDEVVGKGAQIESAENSRIRVLEREILHLRGTLDQMVRQKTELLERRLAIMESCNATLGENYHRMHRMYLELLGKAQA